jgi:NTE family protein
MVFTRLILSGGGLKGLAYTGMIQYFEENNEKFKEIKEFVGTSIGAMTSLLLVLKYDSNSLVKIFESLDINNLRNTKPSIFLENYGFDDGEKIEKLIKVFITNKGHDKNITLKQLYNVTGLKLVTCCVNVDTKKCIYFNENDDIPAHLAVRMSMCLPIIFTPIKYKGHHYIDGALMNDLPCKYTSKEPLANSLCVRLLANSSEVTDIFSYVKNVLRIAFNGNHVENEKYCSENEMTLIKINIDEITFEITDEHKKELHNLGYQVVKEFFEQNV